MKSGDIVAEAAAFCARKLLQGGRKPCMDEELELMEVMLGERGAAIPAREVLRLAYLTELMRELLGVSNAIYGYPHKDRELDRKVIPAFARLFLDVDRPAALAEAFDRHHKRGEAFPRPCDIEALLSAGARRPPRLVMKEEKEGPITPGFARQCYERFKKRLKA